MVGLRFVLLTLALPILGSWIRVRPLPLAARIAVYFGTGLFTIVAEMFVLSMLGVPWSFALLLPLPILFGVRRSYRRFFGEPRDPKRRHGRRTPNAILLLALFAIAILTSVVLAAGATSGDFVFFWGVKGQRWGQERTLDYAFTKEPSHYMHPDYPPLVPLYYAWTMLGGNRALDWWGAMLATPLFLLMSTAALWGFARYAGLRGAEALAAFFATLYALFYIRNAVAGNAEPPLIFFETLALAALTCWRERPGEHDVIAAIALSGVALTKVEGGVFVALVLLTTWIVRRSSWKMGVLPVVTLAAWLIFGYVHGLTDTYVPRDDLSFAYIGITLKEMLRELSLHLWYTPWIALAIFLLCGRARAALPYLAASLGFILFLLSIYTRAEPHLEWSAGRTLMTPFLLALFGAVAAQRSSAPAPHS